MTTPTLAISKPSVVELPPGPCSGAQEDGIPDPCPAGQPQAAAANPLHASLPPCLSAAGTVTQLLLNPGKGWRAQPTAQAPALGKGARHKAVLAAQSLVPHPCPSCISTTDSNMQPRTPSLADTPGFLPPAFCMLALRMSSLRAEDTVASCRVPSLWKNCALVSKVTTSRKPTLMALIGTLCFL